MDLNNVFIYRMVHADNMPHIIKFGITHKESPDSNKSYVPIGDSSLINRRNLFELPNGKLIGEYIPFYFGLRTPMLYVIQKGYNGVGQIDPENIVYLRIPIQRIIDSGIPFVYTDGHAIDGLTTIYFPKDIGGLENQIDHKAAKSKYWKDENDLDLKRRKEAEFLVLHDMEFNFIQGIAVFNNSCKTKLTAIGIDPNIIAITPTLYF